MSSRGSTRRRPRTQALIEPFGWTPGRSGSWRAQWDGLRLSVWRLDGRWYGEIEDGRAWPLLVGGSPKWDDRDARDFCEREARRIRRDAGAGS